MKKFRLIFGILLIIPIALALVSTFLPRYTSLHPALEWTFIIIGIPIAVLNLWAWDAPQIIKTIFNLKD